VYQEDEGPDYPSNILPAINRYKWYLGISVPILLAISTIIILALPPVFRSVGVVLVETQQIPTDLVQSTVTSEASERIQVIKQRVMTRDKLLGVLSKYEFFTPKTDNPAELSAILDSVRQNIIIDVKSARKGNSRAQTAIAFSVAFDSLSPAIAQAISNDLVTLFLNENVKARTERASETTDFLRGEANKIKMALDLTESAVAEFKQKNKDALPEHLDLYVGMREDFRRQINDIERDIRSQKEQLNLLNTQMTLARSGGTIDGGASLSELKDQYRKLSVQYQPAHPDLVSLREQISYLEKGSANLGADEKFSGASLEIQRQITAIETQLESVAFEKQELVDKLADLEERIIRIPQVERGFAALSRDYESKQDQYDEIVSKTMKASMAESLEQGRKAERFSILEPPILPLAPHKPDRKKLLVLGLGASLGLPLGLVVLFGFLDRSIRGSEALALITNAPPLVEIPYIETVEESKENKKRFLIVACGLATAILLGVAFVHLFFMPVDELIGKSLARFGLY